MQSRREWMKGALALVLLTAATGALAGTTGTEFQSLYTWLTGLVQGYFAKPPRWPPSVSARCFRWRGSIPLPFFPASASPCSCNTLRPSRQAS